MPRVARGVEARHAQRDDLALEAHAHAVERLAFGGRLLVLQGRKAGVAAQPGEHRVHGVRFACDGAVDALRRQQQHAAHALFVAQRLQRRAQGGAVGQVDKLVQGNGEIAGGDRVHERRAIEEEEG